MENSDFVIWLIGHLIVAAAIYGGIRADIRNIHYRQDRTDESVKHVSERLDRYIEKG